MIPGPQQRRLHKLAATFGMTRTERHDLALVVVNHEGSWRSLPEADAEKLCLVLIGYAYVQHILRERSAAEHAARARAATPLPPVARRRVPA